MNNIKSMIIIKLTCTVHVTCSMLTILNQLFLCASLRLQYNTTFYMYNIKLTIIIDIHVCVHNQGFYSQLIKIFTKIGPS